MSNNNNYATSDEFMEFMRKNWEKIKPYRFEWVYATLAGWDKVEFERLYNEYVKSTQITLGPGDDATELKGRPLEKISRYFLEKGGIVTGIREISEPQKWQVDGQGLLNKTAIYEVWGEDICRKIGFQLYMEAKNHSVAVTNDEFSVHVRRMVEHDCYCGVLISTSGYKIGRGKGIAESIHRQYWQNRFHLLLVFQSLREIAVDDKPPLAVLTKTLGYAVNNNYVNDAEIQRLYSAESCRKAASAEFQRLFGTQIEDKTS